MAWTDLKAAVAEVVKTNGTQAITGALLQSTLNSIIDQVGANATFKGVATPATTPGTPDGPLFYIAYEKGIYANFNAINITEEDGLVIILYSSDWSKINIPLASKDELVQLSSDLSGYVTTKINKVPKKNLLDISDKITGIHFSGINIVYAEGYNTSNYIEIEPSTFYTVSNIPVNYTGILFYTENKTRIEGGAIQYKGTLTNAQTTFKTPSNAKYLKIGFSNCTDEQLVNAQLEIGMFKTEFEPFELVQTYNRIEPKAVNLYRGTLAGFNFNYTSGFMGPSENGVISNYIPVEEGKTYYIYVDTNDTIYVTGSDWEKEGGVFCYSSNNKKLVVTIPSGVHTISIEDYHANLTNIDVFVSEKELDLIAPIEVLKYMPIETLLDLYDKHQNIEDKLNEFERLPKNLFHEDYIANTDYAIHNNGTHFIANSRIAKIPCEANTIYTFFNGQVSTTFVTLTFVNNNGVAGLSNGYIEEPSVNGPLFTTAPTLATYYTERVYVKTPTDAKYIEFRITDAMNSDINSIGLYEGIYYQNPLKYKHFTNDRINALVIGDSYWDREGANYNDRSIANQLRDLLGINYVMNFAQGGGRLIHSNDTVDVLSYSETYENGSVQNVYSNQFLKYKFRHEAEPATYPIPDVIIIGGVLNNIQFYPTKFDESNYASVWNVNSEQQYETYFSGAIKRLIKEINTLVGSSVPIFFVGSSDTKGNTYNVVKMEEHHNIAAKCFAFQFVSYMEGGMRFYVSDDYMPDGVHPNPISAKKIAEYIAIKILNTKKWVE